MKTLMITLHSINNPGSAWQAYALNKYLNEAGIYNEVIDYRPMYSKVGKNKLKGLLRSCLFWANERKINKKYDSFMKLNMKLTEKKYTSYQQLCKEPPVADIYISGSDQLWNDDYDCGRDEAYYLKFVSDVKKISYATSVGKRELSKESIDNLRCRINSYETISVREKSTSELLSEKLSRKVMWVCDPVFLLEKEEYLGLCKKKSYTNYAVVYLSAASELLDQIIDRVKDELGLTIIQAGGNIKRCKCDIHIKDVGPYDFISLIKDAALVISSSFHATAFSHILHTNFLVLLPPNNGERITSLLSLSRLDNKIVNKLVDLDNALEEPDFCKVDSLIKPFIEMSKEYLLNVVEDKK